MKKTFIAVLMVIYSLGLASPVLAGDEENPAAQFLSASVAGTTQNSATIMFTTTEPTVSSSVYGLSTNYGLTGPSTISGTSHFIVFTNLSPSATYYYKITLTGGEISTGSFTTAAVPADTTAPSIVSITPTPAQTNVSLSFTTNEAASISVFYGLTTLYGSTGPTMSSNTSHNVLVPNLTPGTVYNYKIRMQDSAGNVRDSANYIMVTLPATVTTTVTAPTVTTQSPTGITSTEAVLNATLVSINNGTVTSRGFEWGLTTLYGFVSSVNSSFTSASSFSHILTGLTPATTYQYRAFATNSAGRTNTSNGSFTTSAASSVPVTTVTTTTSSSGGYSAPTAAGGSYCPAGLICTAVTSSSINTASQQFTRNLSLGMRNDDVKALQIYLNNNGFKVAMSGAGSPGMETTYFGPATKVALMKYQRSVGITPVSGFFGPLTRAKLSGGVVASSGVTTAPLVLGNDNLAVKALRTILRTKGYLVAYGTSGVPASASVETTYFGLETQNALKKFQCDKNVVCTGTPDTTGWGKVGPKTRAALGW